MHAGRLKLGHFQKMPARQILSAATVTGGIGKAKPEKCSMNGILAKLVNKIQCLPVRARGNLDQLRESMGSGTCVDKPRDLQKYNSLERSPGPTPFD